MDSQKASELLQYFSKKKKQGNVKGPIITKLQRENEELKNKLAEASNLHKRAAGAAVNINEKLKKEEAKNVQLESDLSRITKEVGKVRGDNVQLTNDLYDTTKKLDKSDKAKSKFKKLAIGLGIGAGAAALGAGAIGTKALVNHNRNKAMLTKMSNNFIGRLGMRASGYGSAIPKYRRSR